MIGTAQAPQFMIRRPGDSISLGYYGSCACVMSPCPCDERTAKPIYDSTNNRYPYPAQEQVSRELQRATSRPETHTPLAEPIESDLSEILEGPWVLPTVVVLAAIALLGGKR